MSATTDVSTMDICTHVMNPMSTTTYQTMLTPLPINTSSAQVEVVESRTNSKRSGALSIGSKSTITSFSAHLTRDADDGSHSTQLFTHIKDVTWQSTNVLRHPHSYSHYSHTLGHLILAEGSDFFSLYHAELVCMGLVTKLCSNTTQQKFYKAFEKLTINRPYSSQLL